MSGDLSTQQHQQNTSYGLMLLLALVAGGGGSLGVQHLSMPTLERRLDAVERSNAILLHRLTVVEQAIEKLVSYEEMRRDSQLSRAPKPSKGKPKPKP